MHALTLTNDGRAKHLSKGVPRRASGTWMSILGANKQRYEQWTENAAYSIFSNLLTSWCEYNREWVPRGTGEQMHVNRMFLQESGAALLLCPVSLIKQAPCNLNKHSIGLVAIPFRTEWKLNWIQANKTCVCVRLFVCRWAVAIECTDLVAREPSTLVTSKQLNCFRSLGMILYNLMNNDDDKQTYDHLDHFLVGGGGGGD